MQDVSFRQATTADQTFLRAMLYRSLYVPVGHEPFSREILEHPGIAKYVEHWGRDGDLALLAVQDSVAVGAAWLRLFRDGQRGYGYVDDETPELSVALLPEYRGRGVGTALLRRLPQATGRSLYPSPKETLPNSFTNAWVLPRLARTTLLW